MTTGHTRASISGHRTMIQPVSSRWMLRSHAEIPKLGHWAYHSYVILRPSARLTRGW